MKKGYMFLLISLFVVSLFLVGCNQTTSKSAVAGQAFKFDGEFYGEKAEAELIKVCNSNKDTKEDFEKCMLNFPEYENMNNEVTEYKARALEIKKELSSEEFKEVDEFMKELGRRKGSWAKECLLAVSCLKAPSKEVVEKVAKKFPKVAKGMKINKTTTTTTISKCDGTKAINNSGTFDCSNWGYTCELSNGGQAWCNSITATTIMPSTTNTTSTTNITSTINNTTSFNLEVTGCVDSDGGETFDVKGNVTETWSNGTINIFTDTCDPDGYVRENLCQNGKSRSIGYSCEHWYKVNTTCQNGFCQ